MGGVQKQMANIKSSLKRVLLAEKAAARNKAAKSLMKTNIKKFDVAASGSDLKSAESAYKIAVKTIDRAVSKGLIHKNKAARRKSALTKKLNSVQSGVSA
jgi:small subunit ribosomal protein S20